jgi:hypothetical protein
MKLDGNQKHLLRLADRGAADGGWVKVSKVVWPLMKSIPHELLEKLPKEEGGFVRLTEAGKTIVRYT